MDLELRDRHALVTAAGRGIGRDVAHTLASEGARVAVLSKDPDNAAKVAEELEG